MRPPLNWIYHVVLRFARGHVKNSEHTLNFMGISPLLGGIRKVVVLIQIQIRRNRSKSSVNLDTAAMEHLLKAICTPDKAQQGNCELQSRILFPLLCQWETLGAA